jgi:hypothetical protein
VFEVEARERRVDQDLLPGPRPRALDLGSELAEITFECVGFDDLARKLEEV